jgi:hypothetical protein
MDTDLSGGLGRRTKRTEYTAGRGRAPCCFRKAQDAALAELDPKDRKKLL